MIIFLKLCSYVQTNYWCRLKYDPSRPRSRVRRISVGSLQEGKSGGSRIQRTYYKAKHIENFMHFLLLHLQ